MSAIWKEGRAHFFDYDDEKPPTAVSLPNNFHFHHSVDNTLRRESKSDEPFFNTDCGYHGAAPIPSVDYKAAKTRLEVLHAWEVNVALVSIIFASLLAFVLVVFTQARLQREWKGSATIPAQTWIEVGLGFFMRVVAVTIPVGFLLCILAHGRPNHEQMWTLMLLLVGLFCSKPLIGNIDTMFGSTMYTTTMYLYLLLSAHSYRILKESFYESGSLYGRNIAVVAMYFIFKFIIGLHTRVVFGLVPFAQVFVWIQLLLGGHHFKGRLTTAVVVATALDASLAYLLRQEVEHTSKFLAQTPYLENRAKQLGFRCFVYQSTIFGVSVLLLAAYSAFSTPSEILYRSVRKNNMLHLKVPSASLGVAIVHFAWTAILAQVNLPPYSVIKFSCLKLYSQLAVLLWINDEDIQEEHLDFLDTFGMQKEGLSLEEVSDTGHGKQSVDLELHYLHRERCDDTDHEYLQSFELRKAYMNARSKELIEMKRKEQFAQYEALIYESMGLSKDKEATRKMRVYTDIRKQGVLIDSSGKVGLLHYPEYMLIDQFSVHNRNGETEQISLQEKIIKPPNVTMGITIEMREGCIPGIEGTGAGGLDTSRLFNLCSLQSNPVYFADDHSCLLRIPQPNAFKLHIRKNLFVMQTQIVLAQASYLSYIPGNAREEQLLPSLRESSSLRKDSRRSMLQESSEFSFSNNSFDVQQNTQSQPFQSFNASPRDEGIKFLVDPAELALEHGFVIFRQISNISNSTHVTVLLGHDRVIVAFSGTRDSKNWATNTRIKRTVFREHFPRFEFEQNDVCKDFKYPLVLLKDEQASTDSPPVSRTKTTIRKSFSVDHLLRSDESSTDLMTPWLSQTNYGSTGRGEGTWRRRKKNRKIALASTVAHELMTMGRAKVHSGFAAAYACVRKQLLGALVELYSGSSALAKGLPIFFCGHSLGGALATFGAFEAAKYSREIGLKNRQQVSCTTFGCPMVGNSVFKRQYERLVETHWRFEMASDPVVNLPSSVLNYNHVGVRVLLDKTGLLMIDPSIVEVNWWGSTANPYLKYKLHMRASYIRALSVYCKQYKSGKEDMADQFWAYPIKAQTDSVFQ